MPFPSNNSRLAAFCSLPAPRAGETGRCMKLGWPIHLAGRAGISVAAPSRINVEMLSDALRPTGWAQCLFPSGNSHPARRQLFQLLFVAAIARLFRLLTALAPAV